MITTPIQIQLPPGFSPDHESLVIGYLADHLYGRRGWAKAFEAFDLLDQAVLVTAQGHFTFRALYQQIVDRQMADAYLGELLTLPDVERQQRYSPSDLTVSGMAGDIKTSIYFVQAAAPLGHDFYIMRLLVRGRKYMLVVLLKPAAWDTIDGDTVPGDLDTVVDRLPAPVRIRHHGHELVVVDYDEWKRRILRLQGEAP